MTETVLGMNNLLLVFDPLALDGNALVARVLDAWPDCESDIPRGKSVEVPVRYGGETGPDLRELAHNAGITVQKFVKLHTEPEYTVFFVGGYPGQPHLGRLHPLLVSPRRHEPRMRVPVGSVAIGGEQASVYPSTQPGGMQLIGHTDVVFFDVARSPPSLLAPGDRVRFRSLGIEK